MKKLTLFAVIAFLLTACTSTPQAELKPQEIALQAEDIKYDVTKLEVTVGQPVRLTFTNIGALEHDFVIKTIAVRDVNEIMMEQDSHTMDNMSGHDMGNMMSTYDLHTSVAAGGQSVLEFTPTEVGTYEFYCTVTGHKEAGMVGQLVVE
jgi:uncharacterized cupredoxin-like copper-binding protein